MAEHQLLALYFAYDPSKVKYWQLIDIPRPISISSCVKQKQPLVATVCMSGLARDQFSDLQIMYTDCE